MTHAKLPLRKPVPDRATARDLALTVYANARHMPQRTCLGCGGSLPENYAGFSQCDARGVEIADYRFTWAELQKFQRLHDIGQTTLDLR